MKRFALLFLLGAVVAVPEIQAQSLLGMYFTCDAANEREADFIMNTVFAETYQKHVDAGHLNNWGWATHMMGGPWRRISTMQADDRSTVLTMWGEIMNELRDDHPGAWHRFQEICNSHQDYVWSTVAGSPPPSPPSNWFSSYWVCNQPRESRADEIMAEVGAVYDRHVAAGHLGGWTWSAHDIGGRFRRLMTLFPAEDFDLLEARDMVLAELQAEHGELLAELGSICGGHVDYLWASGRSTDN
jgi:hypothetical protein